MNFSSQLLENAVNEISQLPGIGKRTALRLVLFLLRQPKSQTHNISKSLTNLVDKITDFQKSIQQSLCFKLANVSFSTFSIILVSKL